RYWVLSGSPRIGNGATPSEFVTTTLPTWANGAVYGNGRCCRTMLRLARSVPVRVAVTVVAAPNGTGFGVANSDRPRGCVGVLNALSPRGVVPATLTATIR